MRKTTTLPPAYFEEKYSVDIDPWQFRSSGYEQEKYQATLRSLAKPQYEKALEVGCSIGVFTRLLSARCENLLAIDASSTAISVAELSRTPNVTFRLATLPADFPEGAFDLIVLSEVLYYFAQADLERVANSCSGSIAGNGEIVLCHWLGETDYPLAGIEASELFSGYIRSTLPARTILHDEIYRLEKFSSV